MPERFKNAESIGMRSTSPSDDKSINSTFRPIKIAILKTDPNGIKDDNIALSIMWRYGMIKNDKRCLQTHLR